MRKLMRRGLLAMAIPAACAPVSALGAPLVFAAAGADATGIQGTVDAFRAAIGGGSTPGPDGSFGGIRREINWDGVDDAFSSPNALPGDFFNVNSPRGVVFSTPGTGFQLSANATNPTSTPVEFGNLNPSYPSNFRTFSSERLFTALGSTVTDIDFFVPGTNTPGFTTAFGAVFTDVDLAATTQVQYFGPGGELIGVFVPPVTGDESLSFVGVVFNEGEMVTRVRIISGNSILTPNNSESPTNPALDVVVMDDFIYRDPQAVPEPGVLGLAAVGAVGLLARRRRK